MYHILTAALLATSSVSALSLSSACETALTQVAANTDANTCLGVSSLITAVLNSNASIITPVDNLLKTLCAAAPCSNATLSAVVTNVTTGCSAELSSVSSSESSSSTLTTLVEQYYSTARQIICLSDSGTNCITEMLTSLQTVFGTLSINNIGTVLENAFTNSTTTIPSNVTCSNCVKGAYNVLNENFPSTASTLASDLQSECGSDFTNGSTPSSIVESASTTSTGSNSASATATIMTRGALAGLSASVLIAGSSLLAFLA
ncbi:hypothetical protein DFH07DRAFT_792628 [Mycena maculata]|uniref:Uncharacterized protein n=1 Tax=Mycena maculata TaxID=230809 RepID=A0AAD7NYL3_9AGAR|nr:hypothetical protein DFH07DRAFT_792628 [Mycena maculata]